jgi:epoxide hydrolase-like predicted phosphatase
MEIKNIIFDLGGVIINLDIPRTIKSFEAFGIKDFEKTYSQLAQTPLFDKFDKGLITENDFFEGIRTQFNLQQSLTEIEEAWNAMLLDFPAHRLQQLLEYKKKYRTFLLSNTNVTHIRSFENTLKNAHQIDNLSSYFEEDYYSCHLHMRKPDAEIFEFVLKEHDLKPEETVFIDDTIIHVKGAEKCGINAFLLPKGAEFKTLLDSIL